MTARESGASSPVETSFRPHPIDWTPEKVGRLWDYYASNPAYGAHYFSRHSGASIQEQVLRHVTLRGSRVLDFGCGPGYMLERLLQDGIAAAGLEFSRRSAEETDRRLRPYPTFRGVTLAERLPSPLPDASFNAVLCVEVMEHLFAAQIEPTLAEIRRLLVPGGFVIATTPNEETLEAETVQCPDCGSQFHRWQHMRCMTASSMARTMESARFATVHCQPTFFGPRRVKRWTSLVRDAWRARRGHPRPPKTPHLLYIGRKV